MPLCPFSGLLWLHSNPRVDQAHVHHQPMMIFFVTFSFSLEQEEANHELSSILSARFMQFEISANKHIIQRPPICAFRGSARHAHHLTRPRRFLSSRSAKLPHHSLTVDANPYVSNFSKEQNFSDINSLMYLFIYSSLFLAHAWGLSAQSHIRLLTWV